MSIIKTYLQRPFYQHLLFWSIVLTSYVIANREHYTSYQEVFLTHLVKVGLQAMVAYGCLWWIIPQFLKKQNKWKLVSRVFLLLWVAHILNTIWRMGCLEPAYPITYTQAKCTYLHDSFWERILNIKILFFTLPITYMQPAVLLIAFQYFQNQRRYLHQSTPIFSSEKTVNRSKYF